MSAKEKIHLPHFKALLERKYAERLSSATLWRYSNGQFPEPFGTIVTDLEAIEALFIDIATRSAIPADQAA